MPTITPATLLGAPKLQLFDNDGNPAAGYFLFTYVAGTSTPANTYSDALLTVANSNPVVLDAAGRATIYLQPGIGYKFVLQTTALVTVWTQDNVNDLSTLLFGYLISTDGSKGVTSGYTVLSTDILLTVNSSGTNPTIINLPAASSRFLPLTIKNIGSNPISVVRAGTDTIEDALTSIGIPAASSPLFPTLTLQSDQVDNWWVVDSVGGVTSGGGGGSGSATILTAKLTLTDAQIKALPTAGQTIVAAPGAGYFLRVWGATFHGRFTAGAYTNVNAVSGHLYLTTAHLGVWLTSSISNDNTLTAPLARLASFLGASELIAPVITYQEDIQSNAGGGDWGYMQPPVNMGTAQLENKPIIVEIDNNGSGDLTGGNAANTMTVTVYYSIESLGS